MHVEWLGDIGLTPRTDITYSSVASWESMHITFLIAALNVRGILATDIGSAYPNAKPQVGPEFDAKLEGKHVWL